jgi:hypothetical protein
MFVSTKTTTPTGMLQNQESGHVTQDTKKCVIS